MPGKMDAAAKQRLADKYKAMKQLINTFAGYPCNAAFDYKDLYRFLEMPMNNVGDALTHSNYQLNTHDFEREVLTIVAKLLGAEEDFWGYVTGGGSEGNLCGLHFARNIYPDAPVFYSKHSHYSIEKAVRITRSAGHCIDVLPNGEIDYEKLENALKPYKGKPVIIMVNIGTTMTGAIDDVDKIKALLKESGITAFYLHADAALHGFVLPFAPGPKKLCLNEIDSVSISGHKFIGSPLPCGIFLTTQQIADQQRQYIEYVDIHDSSITGSRNAFTPLILWYGLQQANEEKLGELVQQCLENTNYLVERLQAEGVNAWANPQSPIVVFPKPSAVVVKKWQLAPYEAIAHIVVMPHMEKPMLDLVIEDLVKDSRGEQVSAEFAKPPLVEKKTWLMWGSGAAIVASLLAVASMTLMD